MFKGLRCQYLGSYIGRPKFGSKTRGKSDARHNNIEVDPRAPPMFDSCCGGARGSSGKNNNAKNNNEDDDAFVTEDIDEQTDGISLGNGWQRWVDFEERRYYYSKGGTTTWDAPTEEETREEDTKN